MRLPQLGHRALGGIKVLTSWMPLLVGCVARPPLDRAATMPACLRVTESSGVWDGGRPSSQYFKLTDSVVATSPDTLRAVATLGADDPTIGVWRRLSQDSLLIRMAVWPEGKEYRLRHDKSTWSGLATYKTSELVKGPDGHEEYGVVTFKTSAEPAPCDRPLAASRGDALANSNLVVAGVHLGMERSDVDAILRPRRVATAGRIEVEGFAVEFDTAGHARRLVLTSPTRATARGLRVGDSLARANELYGRQWLVFSTRDSTMTLGLPREDEWVGLTVIVRGGRIVEIDLGPVTSLG